MPDCPVCHHYYFPEPLAQKIGARPHVCPPVWLVREESDAPEDAQRVYAARPEVAAHDFVQNRDTGTGYADFTTRAYVLVARETEDGDPPTWARFCVRGEMTITYTVAPEDAP